MAREMDPLKELQAVVARHASQREAAETLDISQAYLNDLLQGNRKFSDAILEKLGLARVTTVVKL